MLDSGVKSVNAAGLVPPLFSYDRFVLCSFEHLPHCVSLEPGYLSDSCESHLQVDMHREEDVNYPDFIIDQFWLYLSCLRVGASIRVQNCVSIDNSDPILPDEPEELLCTTSRRPYL